MISMFFSDNKSTPKDSVIDKKNFFKLFSCLNYKMMLRLYLLVYTFCLTDRRKVVRRIIVCGNNPEKKKII